MQPYDRADRKAREVRQQNKDEAAYWEQYYELYDFFYGPPYESESITIEDVRKGWLFTFLIKLGLKTPKEYIDFLRW